MKKVLLRTLAVVVVVAIGAVLYTLTRLDSLVAGAIEDHGSRVTDTSVSVSGVDISLREGRGTIAGLVVASPGGYAADEAFTLGEITLDLDLQSLRGEPIVIEEIRVAAPVIRAEFAADGSSNIDDLRRRIQDYTAGIAADGDPADEDAKRLRIERFVFEQGRIGVDASALGLDERTVDLPAIRLEDIGGAEGALPDEIARAVLDALSRRAVAEIASSGVREAVKDKLSDAFGDEARGLLDRVGR